MAENVLTVDFPFEVVEKNKKVSDTKISEVMRSICAFLNSNGGLIRLQCENKQTFSVDKLVRKFEQRLKEVVGSYGSCSTFNVLPAAVSDGSEILIKVEGFQRLCTLNYNLYLPNETQVHLIPPNEPVENVLRILNGPDVVESEELIHLGSHRKVFVLGEVVGGRESKTEQFKKLKHELSKNVCLGDRMVNRSNKFTCYVSAFANYRGGHIYYGIRDDGVVEGEIVEENNRALIVSKVKKAIEKMVWPNDCGVPERARHWDVFFEPIRSSEDEHKQIPSSFVIVISVLHCTGGVFTEKPESYFVVSGKCAAIPFEIWKMLAEKRNLHGFCNRKQVARGVTRCEWSLSKMGKLYLKSREELAKLRNNGDKTGFADLAKSIATSYSHDNFKAIILQQRAASCYREHHFPQAHDLLEQSKEMLRSCNDPLPILEIENLYWESLVLRCLGRADESVCCRVDGMQLIESFPCPDIIGAWFHFQQGRALERRIGGNDCNECSALIEQAKVCYGQALKHASQLPESTSVVELKQRAYNRLAILHLGCFFHDNKISRTKCTVQHDLDEAEEALEVVNRSTRCQGWTMTTFCRCEHLLARSEQNFRSWQTFGEEYFLRAALDESSRALAICEQKNFQEVISWTLAQIQELNSNLNCG